MNDTPTPRVDAQADHAGNFHNLARVVDADFARDLEHQLAEATAALLFIRDECDWECDELGGDNRIGPACTKALDSIRQQLPNPPTV